MKLCKLLLTVMGATVLLGALVTSASATSLEVSTQNIRAEWRRMDFTGPFGTVECEVTLAGSLHSRIATKRIESLLGYINATDISNACARGSATILRETLPWHVRYDSFAGTLPNITQVRTRVVGAAFRIALGATNCLSLTTATQPSIGTYSLNASGEVTSVTVGGRIRTNCFGIEGTLGGTSTRNDALRVNLI